MNEWDDKTDADILREFRALPAKDDWAPNLITYEVAGDFMCVCGEATVVESRLLT